MCRLLYLPRRYRPALPILTDWLEKLTKSFGGDGAGYASPKVGMRKSLALTPGECAEELYRIRGGVVWHTRKVSCGAKSDKLCHPFPAGTGWLVHNGHWEMGAFSASILAGDWSDTAVAAHYINLHGWDSFTRRCNSGVWLYLNGKGHIRVHYATGDLWVDTISGAMASEPCDGWGKWTPAEYGTFVGSATERLFTPLRQPGFWSPKYATARF